MNKKQILVLSEALDFHGRAVFWALKELGHNAVWWDRTRTPVDDTVTVRLGPARDASVATDSAQIRLAEGAYRAIWNRRGQVPTVDPSLCESDKVLARQEAKFLLEGIVACLEQVNPGALVINSLRTTIFGNSKVHQLLAANQAGFRIPETLVSNNVQEVRQFAESFPGGIIAKMHIPYSWRDAHGVVRISGTMPVSAGDLSSDKSVKSAPMIYQHKLPSQMELRVVVFGHTAMAISQSRPAGSKRYVDLRWEEVIEASAYAVPDDLKARCLEFMKIVGLTYAAFDILVDEEGNQTFLEANECGQFLYLEEKVPEVTILDAFCQYLASGSTQFEYQRSSGITLARYLVTDDATECRELMARHWSESKKFSPFELAE
jgi:glutathione synthase/RimK-type ligase-like ATP-grasp enzyme